MFDEVEKVKIMKLLDSISERVKCQIWKQANITPIFKKNYVSDPTNYRPISLLSSIGKVLKKIVHKRIFDFFRDNQAINPTVGKQDPWYLPFVYNAISFSSASEKTDLRQIGKFLLLTCFAERIAVTGMPS